MNRRHVLTVCLLLAASTTASAYIRSMVQEGVPLYRTDAVRIPVFVHTSMVAGATNAQSGVMITAGSDPTQAIANSLASWSMVPNSTAMFAPPQSTSASNDSEDGIMTLTIEDTVDNRDIVGDALAVTVTWFDEIGAIFDSDIIFGSRIMFGRVQVPFSTDHTSFTYDLQSVATHELGHTLGANHTPVLSASMFQAVGRFSGAVNPDETTMQSVISPDDAAFLAEAYPSGDAAEHYGRIHGRVAYQGGSPVRGALVVAVDASAGVTVSSFSSLNDGQYSIGRVPPGSYVVYAQPANGPVTPANISVLRSGNPDTTFRTTFFGGNASPASVPVGGGTSRTADISVDPQPAAMQIGFIGIGPPGGLAWTSAHGAKAVVSGQSTEVYLWGPGLSTNTDPSQLQVLGPGLSVQAGSFRSDPESISENYVPLRFTLDVAPRNTRATATFVVVNGTDAAAYSGGLLILPSSTAPSCTYLLSTRSATVGITGGSGVVDVQTTPECSWTATSNADWITVTAGGSGTSNGTVSYQVADDSSSNRVGTLNIAGQSFTIRQFGRGITQLDAAVNSASYQPLVSPGGFMTLWGSNLTDRALTWDSIISGISLPVVLGGVSVKVGGKDCYVNYAGPGQLNVLLPPDAPTGQAVVAMTTLNGTYTLSANVAPYAPAFFGYPLNSRFYLAALFANNPGEFLRVAAVGALGEPSRPARAGDYLQLYATGLGPTAEAYPAGEVLTKAYPVADLSQVTVTIGGVPAEVLYAGMTFAGVFQVNIRVPSGIGNGDLPVALTIAGNSTQPNAFLTFEN